MVLLARRYGEGPVSLTQLAERDEMPLPYLEQLIGPLRRDGLVVSQSPPAGSSDTYHNAIRLQVLNR